MIKTLTSEQITACRKRIVKLKESRKWPVENWFNDEDFETALNNIEQLQAENDKLKVITKGLLDGYCNMSQTLQSDFQFMGDQLTEEAQQALKE